MFAMTRSTLGLTLGLLCVALLSQDGTAQSQGREDGTRSAEVLSTTPVSDDATRALIRSRIPGADQMRFGNTREEAELAAWEPYSEYRLWQLPGYTYQVENVVFAHYRGLKLAPFVLRLPVFQKKPEEIPSGVTWPFIKFEDSRASDVIVRSTFDVWNERWVTYQDAYGFGNVFYPMTYQMTGGVDGKGFVWVDDSRWGVDAPETPDSILVAVVYWRWLFPPEWRGRTSMTGEVDLRDTVLDVSLRGRQLKLGGAQVTFWFTCDGQRHHLKQSTLKVSTLWTANHLSLPARPEAWDLSWARPGATPSFCIDRANSYGFAFRDVRREAPVTGVFEMDDFRLTRTPKHP